MKFQLSSGFQEGFQQEIEPKDIWRFSQIQNLYNDVGEDGIFILPEIITEADLKDALKSDNGYTETLAGLYTQDFMGGLTLRIEINGKEYHQNTELGNFGEKISDGYLDYNSLNLTFNLYADEEKKEYQRGTYYIHSKSIEYLKRIIKSNFRYTIHFFPLDMTDSDDRKICFEFEKNFRCQKFVLDQHAYEICLLCGKESLCHSTAVNVLDSFFTRTISNGLDKQMLKNVLSVIDKFEMNYIMQPYINRNLTGQFSNTIQNNLTDSKRNINKIVTLGGLLMYAQNIDKIEHKINITSFCDCSEINTKHTTIENKFFIARITYCCHTTVKYIDGNYLDIIIPFPNSSYSYSRNDNNLPQKNIIIEGHHEFASQFGHHPWMTYHIGLYEPIPNHYIKEPHMGTGIFEQQYIPNILPKHLWELLKDTKLKKLQQQVVQKLQKTLTIKNMIDEFGLDLDKFDEYIGYIRSYDAIYPIK